MFEHVYTVYIHEQWPANLPHTTYIICQCIVFLQRILMVHVIFHIYVQWNCMSCLQQDTSDQYTRTMCASLCTVSIIHVCNVMYTRWGWMIYFWDWYKFFKAVEAIMYMYYVCFMCSWLVFGLHVHVCHFCSGSFHPFLPCVLHLIVHVQVLFFHIFISGTCSNCAKATPTQSLLPSVDILSPRGKPGVCDRRRSH